MESVLFATTDKSWFCIPTLLALLQWLSQLQILCTDLVQICENWALRCFTTEEKRFRSIQYFAECHLVGDILPEGWSWAAATPRGSPQCASEGKMCILAITRIASSNPECTWFILSKYPKVKYIFGASDQLQGST